jgi:hypothetical protein
MTISEWAEQVPTGGRFVKLRLTGDTPVEGTILSVERRDRTDPQGNVVMKKGTSTPRTVWWFRLQTAERDGAEDDGVRILEANESMTRAVRDAEKASGSVLAVGGTIKVGVKADPADDFSQATYIARYTPPSALAAADDLADF